MPRFAMGLACENPPQASSEAPQGEIGAASSSGGGEGAAGADESEGGGDAGARSSLGYVDDMGGLPLLLSAAASHAQTSCKKKKKKKKLTTADGSCRACGNPRLKLTHACGKGGHRSRPVDGQPRPCPRCAGRKKRHTCGRGYLAARLLPKPCPACAQRAQKLRTTVPHTCGQFTRAAKTARREELMAKVARGVCIKCELRAAGSPEYIKAYHHDGCRKFQGAARSDDCALCREISLAGFQTLVYVRLQREVGHVCAPRGRRGRRADSNPPLGQPLAREAGSEAEALVVARPSAARRKAARPQPVGDGAHVGWQPEGAGQGTGVCLALAPTAPEPEVAPLRRVDEMLIAATQHRAVLTLSDAIFAMGRAVCKARKDPATAKAIARWRKRSRPPGRPRTD